jgi:hypothetical protein
MLMWMKHCWTHSCLFYRMFKMFRYFKFRSSQNEKVTAGWQRDDQLTYRAENSSLSQESITVTYILVSETSWYWRRRVIMWHLSEKSSEYEAKRTKTISGNEVMQTSLTNLDTLYLEKRWNKATKRWLFVNVQPLVQNHASLHIMLQTSPTAKSPTQPDKI